MNNIKKTKLKLYILVGSHMLWLFFVIYVTGFAREESFLRNNKTGVFVLLYIAIVTFLFVRFLLSKEFAKHEKAMKKNIKSNVILNVSMVEKSRIVENIKSVVEKSNFLVESYNNEINIELVAYRRKFLFKSFTFVSQEILILQKEDVQISDYKVLYEYGIKYAKQKNKLKGFFGIATTHMIFPYIISSKFNEKTKKYLEAEPNSNWHLLQLPIGCELSTGNIYFFNGKLSYGMIFNKDYKKIVNEYIVKGIVHEHNFS